MSLDFYADQYVNTVVAQMNSFIDAVRSYSYNRYNVGPLGFSYAPIDPTFTDSIKAVAESTVPAEPSFTAFTATKPVLSAIPSVAVPTLGPEPELTLAAPVLNLPTAPNTTLPAAPGAAPTFTAPTLPTAPAITLPPVPTFENIALPTAPSIEVPLFTTTLPIDELTAPTENFTWNEAGYSSELLDALRAKLLSDVQNGGYGVEPQDEMALWERMRERELLAAEANIQEAARQAAARGFMLPPGALFAQIEGARNEALAKSSTANRDVALKRAELYAQNRQFALTTAKEVEDMMLRYYGFMAERALNAARFVAEFGVNIYNARVSRFNAQLEATRVSAQMYETRLRASLAHLEVYKTKVEGARLSVDVQKLMADVYRTQLDGAQVLANIYRTRIDAAKVESEVELAKLSAFKASVDAYIAQVGAKESEFKMFTAQLQGEMAKVDVFKTSVGAYAAQVDAYRAKADAKASIVQAQTSAASLVLDKHKAELLSYASELETYNTQVRAALSLNEARLKKYEVRVDAEAKAVQSKVQMWATNSQTFAEIARAQSAHQLGAAQAHAANANVAVGAASAGMQGIGQALAAALDASSQITAHITSR